MRQKINQLLSRIPWYIKNVYFASLAVFLIWMLFFNRYNVFYQYKINHQLNQLEKQKRFYAEEIQKVEDLTTELFSTDEKKEKFARENYWMKKENEDIFIIVEQEE